MTRDEQFACIEMARRQILTWAQAHGILLHRVEYVVPFVETDFGLAVWFFFKTDEELQKVSEGGREAEIKSAFVDILRSIGYANEWNRRNHFCI